MFIALKLDTVFAPCKSWPPTELVVNNAALIEPEFSANVPVDVSDTLFAPAATAPVMLILPVLLIVTSPVPFCVIPVTVNGAALFVN